VLLLSGQDAEHDHDNLGEVVEGTQLPNERRCAAIRQRGVISIDNPKSEISNP